MVITFFCLNFVFNQWNYYACCETIYATKIGWHIHLSTEI